MIQVNWNLRHSSLSQLCSPKIENRPALSFDSFWSSYLLVLCLHQYWCTDVQQMWADFGGVCVCVCCKHGPVKHILGHTEVNQRKTFPVLQDFMVVDSLILLQISSTQVVLLFVHPLEWGFLSLLWINKQTCQKKKILDGNFPPGLLKKNNITRSSVC